MNTNIQVSVYQDQNLLGAPLPPPLDQAPVKLPPVVQRGAEIVGSLIVGGMGGYTFYWMERLTKLFESGGAAINPVVYILSGMISAAIVEMARLIYDLAMSVLGDRQKLENLNDLEKAATWDHLRQRTWKVISCIEKVEQDIDVIFSRIFHIRTAKQIQDQDIQEKELYVMEVIRRIFLEQVSEMRTVMVPRLMSMHLVKAIGYMIMGEHLLILGQVWSFSYKIHSVYKRIDAERMAEARKRRQELEITITDEIRRPEFC
jgi:hypothetical protein